MRDALHSRRDFAQERRRIGISAPGDGNLSQQSVKTYGLRDRCEGSETLRRRKHQGPGGASARQRYLNTASSELCCEIFEPGACGIVLRKHQCGKVLSQKRERPVTDFGAAVGFRMQPAGFLGLERSFLRQAETDSA